MSFVTRLLNLFRARSLEHDLDDEVRFHLHERAAANVRRGMPRPLAERSAHEQFGDIDLVKQRMKEARVINKWPALTFVVGIVVGAALTALLRPAVPTTQGGYYLMGQKDISTPVALHQVKPHYTPDAIRDQITGTVELTCVVQPNGACDAAQVTRSLDPRLDREAVSALQGWRFRPGEYRGTPVPVRVTVEMRFTLS